MMFVYIIGAGRLEPQPAHIKPERGSDMTKKLILPIETLHKLLRCDPIAGLLFWHERTPDMFSDGGFGRYVNCKRWNSRLSDKEAFTSDNGLGYKRGKIFGHDYLAHRVIWAMETGAWPVDQIDHINHNKTDNRFVNLREATATENQRNRSMQKNNTSGHTGVFWDKRDGKWSAEIRAGGKQINLGHFDNMDEAIATRAAASIEHGYHDNHGEPQ